MNLLAGPAPTPRTAALLVVCALSVLLVGVPVAGLLALIVVAAAAGDALAVRATPEVRRDLPATMSRGVGVPVSISVQAGHAGRCVLRQPLPASLRLDPQAAAGRIDGMLVGLRRGRHRIGPTALRLRGPLGLAAWFHQAGGAHEVVVYPDVVAARSLALAVQRGRFREPGRAPSGPLGIGTEFESIRDYVPDDELRQVNWKATARLGRPMSNQYRVEQDRDVIIVLDTGRLMGAPVDGRSRLDAAADAAAAVALVADVSADRCGLVAFDAVVRRRLVPRRAGGAGVVRAILDLESVAEDSDYALAFRAVGSGKRAFVLVLTDLFEERAARPLIEAMGVLARRHAVAVATCADPDLHAYLAAPPVAARGAYRALAAVEVIEARERAAAQLRRAGAEVVQARPDSLAASCVGAYLRAKAHVRV